jgi:hypothetical protein
MLTLPLTYWLVCLCATVLAGYWLINSIVDRWKQCQKSRRRHRRRLDDDDVDIPNPRTTTTAGGSSRKIHSMTQTETTFHRHWQTAKFGPLPAVSHGAWVDVP